MGPPEDSPLPDPSVSEMQNLVERKRSYDAQSRVAWWMAVVVASCLAAALSVNYATSFDTTSFIADSAVFVFSLLAAALLLVGDPFAPVEVGRGVRVWWYRINGKGKLALTLMLCATVWTATSGTNEFLRKKSDGKEAAKLRDTVAGISGQAADIEDQLEKAAKALESFDERFAEANKQLETLGGTATGLLKNVGETNEQLDRTSKTLAANQNQAKTTIDEIVQALSGMSEDQTEIAIVTLRALLRTDEQARRAATNYATLISRIDGIAIPNYSAKLQEIHDAVTPKPAQGDLDAEKKEGGETTTPGQPPAGPVVDAFGPPSSDKAQ